MKKLSMGLSCFVQEGACVVVAELCKGCFLELADAFLGKADNGRDFLEVNIGFGFKPVIELDNLLFLAGEIVRKHLGERFGACASQGEFVGAQAFVRNCVAEGHFAIFADRSVQGGGLVAHHENLLDIGGFVLGKPFEALGVNGDRSADKLAGFLGVAAEAAEDEFLFGADADQTALFGDGAGDVLADPPHGVADKLDFLVRVKTAGGLDETHIAFVDELVDVETLASVKLGDVHDEAEVGFDQEIHRGSVALLDLAENDLLLFLGEQRVLGDIVKILKKDVLFVPAARCLDHFSLTCC